MEERRGGEGKRLVGCVGYDGGEGRRGLLWGCEGMGNEGGEKDGGGVEMGWGAGEFNG